MAVYENIIDPFSVATSAGVVVVGADYSDGGEVVFDVRFESEHGHFAALYIEKSESWPDGLDPENDRDFPNFEAIAERFGRWAGDAYRKHGPRFEGLYTHDWRKFHNEPPEDDSPKEYRVRWEIDVTATSPKEAALQVRRDYMFQFIDGPQADVFDVIRNGKTVRVDLSDKPEEEESEE